MRGLAPGSTASSWPPAPSATLPRPEFLDCCCALCGLRCCFRRGDPCYYDSVCESCELHPPAAGLLSRSLVCVPLLLSCTFSNHLSTCFCLLVVTAGLAHIPSLCNLKHCQGAGALPAGRCQCSCSCVSTCASRCNPTRCDQSILHWDVALPAAPRPGPFVAGLVHSAGLLHGPGRCTVDFEVSHCGLLSDVSGR